MSTELQTLDDGRSTRRAYYSSWRAANLNRVQAYDRERSATNKEKKAEYDRAYRAANPTKVASRKYEDSYGITLEQVLAMFDAAGDSCECCGICVARPLTGAKKAEVGHVDHCHSTGKVRGILCTNCNTGIGKLRDRPELAVAYLERTAK